MKECPVCSKLLDDDEWHLQRCHLCEIGRLLAAIREWHDGVIGGEHKLRQIAREEEK